VTVLQPLTPLRDVSIPQRPLLPEDDWRLLGTWSAAMQRALNEDRPGDAVLLSHVVLRQLPRHLATYLRLIRAAWMLRRWEEGDSWGRRLLRADPSNALAWRAVAMASEQRSERSRSHARWQRAFESDPYEPEIRAGLVRTSVDLARLPALNDSCLATLYLRGMRWEQAAELFAALAERDNRRTDYQIGQLLALWQLGLNEQAYELAGRLTQTQPYLLYAWIVTDATGDANDQALARHPLTTMDPDGDYLRLSTGLAAPDRQVRLNLTEADKEVLERVLPEAESLQADD
jgi:tetratricopeptide (TPR) repeat protein